MKKVTLTALIFSLIVMAVSCGTNTKTSDVPEKSGMSIDSKEIHNTQNGTFPVAVDDTPVETAEKLGPRLTEVNLYIDGQLDVRYTYTYEDCSLPSAGRMEVLGDHSMAIGNRTVDTMPDTLMTYTYDNIGRLICYESVIEASGNANIFRLEYDGDGRLIRDEWEHTGAQNGECLGTDYTYDESGHLVSSTDEGEYGIVNYVNEYDCDEDGRITSQRLYPVTDWDDAGEPTVWDPDPVSEIKYVYDENGRVVKETNLYNGEVDSETTYTYGNDKYFVVQCGDKKDYLNGNDETFCLFIINDSVGKGLLSFHLPGTPELTYDDLGYLVKAESGNKAMEFVYEK